MKKVILIIFLSIFFVFTSKADTVGDFEIEGISVGNSLLKYFSRDEIKKDILKYDHSNQFIGSFILRHPSFNTYDALTLAYKTNDDNYIIHSIEASISYKDNIEQCYKQKKEIELELSEIFNKKPESYKDYYYPDPSKNSTVNVSEFYLEEGSVVRVICYDIFEKLSNEKGWWDRLSVVINTKEFVEFLRY